MHGVRVVNLATNQTARHYPAGVWSALAGSVESTRQNHAGSLRLWHAAQHDCGPQKRATECSCTSLATPLVRVPAAGLRSAAGSSKTNAAARQSNEKAPAQRLLRTGGFMRRWGWIAGTVTERHTAKIVPVPVGRRITGCDTSGRFSGDDQSLQSDFNHGDLCVDLADWHAEVVARSCVGPELERQPLPMLPEIFKRATVLMPDVHLNDLLHRF